MSVRCLYIILSLFIALPGFSLSNNGEKNTGKPAGPLFLPYTEFSLSGKYYTPFRNDYHSAMDIFVLTELFRMGKFDLAFDFTGTTTFREKSGGIEPDLIFYRINYLTAGWNTSGGRAGIFIDHLCNNRINVNDREDDKIRWYGAGFRWDAPGFSGREKVRYEGKRPYLTGSISAAYAWQTEIYPYKFHLSGTIRATGPDMFFFFPYLEGSITGKFGDEKNLDVKSEAGIKAMWKEGEFNLFTGTECVGGTNGYYAKEDLNHFTGIRLTSWIVDDHGEHDVTPHGRQKFPFPKIFLNGEYGKYINKNRLNFHTNIQILLYLPAAESFGLYGSTGLKHDSLNESNGMYPRYMQYSFEGGLNIDPGIMGITVIPYNRYQRYDEGNTYDGYSNWFVSAGARIATVSYHSDSRMMQNRSLRTETWIPRIWASFERIYRNGSFPVNWIVRFDISQWIVREKIVGISLSGFYTKYFGDFERYEYSVEPALVLGRKRILAFFYRYTFREKEMVENGIFSPEHLVGVRFVI